MKPSELLIKPGVWIKGCGFRAKDGTELPSSSIEWAPCCCLIGALAKCAGGWNSTCGGWIKQLEEALQKKGFTNTIDVWNDDPRRTLNDVVWLLYECGL